MRAFFSIVGVRFKRDLQYRSVYFYSMLTQIAFGVIYCMARGAFLRGDESVMTLSQVMTYTWIGQATLRVQAWGGDGEVQALIRNGDVAYELMRPMGLSRYWYARAMALRLVPVALIVLPQILIAAFIMPRDIALTIPGAAACVAYAFALFGVVILSAAVTTLMSVSLLFTISGEGISRFLPAITIFLSGGAVPLALFPEWAQPIVTALPFAYMYDIPARLFTGMLQPEAVFSILAVQIGWALAIMVIVQMMERAGLKRLRVQGG